MLPSSHSAADQHRMVDEQIASETAKSKSQQQAQDSCPIQPTFQVQSLNEEVKTHVIDGLVKKEEIKLPMIVPANAIPNPKAMMIVSFNANSTLPAVPSPIFTGYLACTAVKFIRFCFAQQMIRHFHLFFRLCCRICFVMQNYRSRLNSIAQFIVFEGNDVTGNSSNPKNKQCCDSLHTLSLIFFRSIPRNNNTLKMTKHRKPHGKRYHKPIEIIRSSIRLFLPGDQFSDQSAALHIINQMKITSMMSTIMKQHSMRHVQT